MSLEVSRSLPLLFLLLLRMSDSYRPYNPRVALCPHDNSIEGLVDFCNDVITLTYDVIDDDINNYSIRDEQRIVNSTCTAYKKRYSCYNRLLLHCQTDPAVSSDIRMIIDRLSIYSRTCHRDTQGGMQLIRCYNRFSKQMRTCSQAFDAYYPLYVVQHQSSACRVLNSAINCLLQIEQEITDSCRNPIWSGDFHSAYIRPLVHRSQNSSYHLKCPINSNLRDIHFPGASLSSSSTSSLSLAAKCIFLLFKLIFESC